MQIENNVVVKVIDGDIINGTVTIPQGVTSIGDRAFFGCQSLTSITIPEGVISIGFQAFFQCQRLKSIIIPEGVTSIDRAAFYNCKSLPSITIPARVTSISDHAFYGCTSLTSITIPEGVTSIDNRAFHMCKSITSITILAGVISIGNCAFSGCQSLTSITIPEGVTSIDDYAFDGCTSLTSIIVLAENEAKFNRIKNLLPEAYRSKADHGGQKQFNLILKPINDFINAGAIVTVDKLNQFITAAEAHLERIKPCEVAYNKQKKTFDSLIVELHLHQGDARAALEHFLENPNLNETTILNLASNFFGLIVVDRVVKHKAMIALFKEHHQNAVINHLLTQSALYLLNGKEAPLGSLLQEYKIEKFVPLALIKQQLEKAIKGMDNSSELKEPLRQIQNKLELLNQNEMKKLLSISPIKEAFEKELGTAQIVAFESFYNLQPEKSHLLPGDPLRFLNTTLQLLVMEKRAEKNQNESIASICVTAVLNQLPNSEDAEPDHEMNVDNHSSGGQFSRW